MTAPRQSSPGESLSCAADGRAAELVQNLPCIIWEARGDPELGVRQITFVSPYAEVLLGYPPAFWLQGGGGWECLIDDAAERARFRDEMAGVLATGRPGSVQFPVRRRDGQVCWLEAAVTPILSDHALPVGLRGVALDVTARKEAEAALEQRVRDLARVAQQLRRTNQELDQFAYITSHDLRAPLRGIANLSRWIEEDMGPAMTPEAHQQMEMLRGRVNRLESLISGLLQYSRVGRVSTYVEDIDVEKLVAGVVELLSPPPGFRVEIEGPLPILRGEKIRLQQVFMNLIGNAIKHHHRPEEGRVTIRCREEGEWYRFDVADNGPGIASRYHQKIFVIFQTLTPRDQKEAAGVGLSLVKKIVEEQGGSIELDSDEGRGARFSFTWPKQRPEQ